MPFDVRCTVKGSVSDRVVVSKWVAVGNRELVRLGVWVDEFGGLQITKLIVHTSQRSLLRILFVGWNAMRGCFGMIIPKHQLDGMVSWFERNNALA